MLLILFCIIPWISRNRHGSCYIWMHEVPVASLTVSILKTNSFQVSYQLWNSSRQFQFSPASITQSKFTPNGRTFRECHLPLTRLYAIPLRRGPSEVAVMHPVAVCAWPVMWQWPMLHPSIQFPWSLVRERGKARTGFLAVAAVFADQRVAADDCDSKCAALCHYKMTREPFSFTSNSGYFRDFSESTDLKVPRRTRYPSPARPMNSRLRSMRFHVTLLALPGVPLFKLRLQRAEHVGFVQAPSGS